MRDKVGSMTESKVIRKLVDLNESIFNDSEKKQIYKFHERNRQASSQYSELCSCPNFEAKITLTNDEPFFIRPYKLSEEDKKIVSRELDKLVKLGFNHIPPLSFSFGKKGSRDKRVVTDFRYSNDRIKRINHSFPMLKLNETLLTIDNSEAKVLSVIDLKSAFFCLPLCAKAQQYILVKPPSYSGGKHYFY